MFGENRRPLLFFDFGFHYGGSFQSTVQLIRGLHELAEVRTVDVFGTSPEYLQDLQSAGASISVLFPAWRWKTFIGGTNPLTRAASLLLYVPSIIPTILHLRRRIAEYHPRAIWVNTEKALFVAWLAAPPRLPVVVYIRSELKRLRPYCFWAWRRVDMAIGVSEKSLQTLRSSRWAHGNYRTIYNGIDVEKTLCRAERVPDPLPEFAAGALRIVLPASIGSPLKGHEAAIRALAEFIQQGGKAILILCGDVPPGASSATLHRIQKLIGALNLEKSVHLLGWRRDVLSIIARADAVLLPSFTEGLPRALLEGMALEKPVIATRVGGIPELVREGVDGLLVEPGDASGLARAFWTLADPLQRKQMGQAAQRRIREHFSLAKQAREFFLAIETVEKSWAHFVGHAK